MAGDSEDHYCFACPATDSIIHANCYKTSQESHPQYFYIKIHAELSYVDIEHDEEQQDDDFLLIGKQDSKSSVSRFLVPTDQLECEIKSWRLSISGILSRIGVPLEHQPFIIRRITICANQLLKDPWNVDRKVLPMVVSFGSFIDLQNQQGNTLLRKSRQNEGE